MEISYVTKVVEENDNKIQSQKAESTIADKNVEPIESKIKLPLEDTEKSRSAYKKIKEKPNGKNLRKKLIWTFSGIGLLVIIFWIGTTVFKQFPFSTPQPNTLEIDPTKFNLSSISTPDSTLTVMSLSATPIEENVKQKISEVDEMVMLYVPEGIFLMGDDSDSAYTNEKPVHEVFLNAYWIDKHEVTNNQYKLCVEAGQCSMPKNAEFLNFQKYENQPAVNITWLQAKEYCNWAERDLPTEAQWEKAARGPNGQIYPWGDLQPDIKIANFNNNIGKTTMAGNYPDGVSYYGLHDMAGNVWEWVNDWYSKDYYSSQTEWKNPEGPDSIQLKVIRGGSWNSPALHLRSSYRSWFIYDSSNEDIGFRCAMDADQ